MRNSILPEDRDLWQIRPSFRAVAVVAFFEDYPLYEEYIPETPLWIIRTGDEEGLSAPICLETVDENATIDKVVGKDGKPRESVYTTLEKAYRFLSALEQREIAAFGHQPDPTRKGRLWGPLGCSYRSDKYEGLSMEEEYEKVDEEARRLGWEGAFNVEAPNSTWIDIDLYPATHVGSCNITHMACRRGYNFRTRRAKETCRKGFIVRHY